MHPISQGIHIAFAVEAALDVYEFKCPSAASVLATQCPNKYKQSQLWGLALICVSRSFLRRVCIDVLSSTLSGPRPRREFLVVFTALLIFFLDRFCQRICHTVSSLFDCDRLARLWFMVVNGQSEDVPLNGPRLGRDFFVAFSYF